MKSTDDGPTARTPKLANYVLVALAIYLIVAYLIMPLFEPEKENHQPDPETVERASAVID